VAVLRLRVTAYSRHLVILGNAEAGALDPGLGSLQDSFQAHVITERQQILGHSLVRVVGPQHRTRRSHLHDPGGVSRRCRRPP
jgi:hypothetical protein